MLPNAIARISKHIGANKIKMRRQLHKTKYILPVFPKLFYLWNALVVLKKKGPCENKWRFLFITSRFTVLVRNNICPSHSNYTCVILYANNNQVRNQELLSERCFFVCDHKRVLELSKAPNPLGKFVIF